MVSSGINLMKSKEARIEKRWGRKFIKLIFFAVFVFVLSGVSLIVIDCCLFPHLAAVKWLGKYEFFKKATEKVVVVNKTEQVTVSEDQTVSSYSNKSASSVAEILSFREEKILEKRKEAEVKYGSGLIITADGLVLTYKDALVDDRAKYRIFTQKDKFFEARLVMIDNFTNLALLKIDGVENLPVASFIAPEDMKTGVKAVVIGRSGSNFQPIYKFGVVSQYDNDFSLAGVLPLSEKLQGVYTADFDISGEKDEGLIGGAVTNYNGDVIGLLGRRKISDQRHYFIIPPDIIQDFVNQYLSAGSVRRGSLGVYYRSLSSELAAVFGGRNQGALIYSPSGQQGLAVLSGSAAEKAGLKINDVILSVNGEEVDFEKNLARLVSKYKPGEVINLKIVREGKEMEARAVLQ